MYKTLKFYVRVRVRIAVRIVYGEVLHALIIIVVKDWSWGHFEGLHLVKELI